MFNEIIYNAGRLIASLISANDKVKPHGSLWGFFIVWRKVMPSSKSLLFSP